ncbi:MAG: nucleotidyltransferase family protein [Kordiimonadaceae bacterium]|nr:nucleotidyltransferase family protein [Kordiimonadaceae bacterium]
MVLAAGKGSRMGALSDTLPKPLTLVNGQTLLERLLAHIRRAGCDKTIVNVHHLPEKIETALAEEIEAGFVEISDERADLLETGGGVKKALPLLGSQPFFVLNGDALLVDAVDTPASLVRLREHWDNDKMDVLLLLTRREEALGYEGVGDFYAAETDETLTVEFRDSRPDAPYAYCGVQLVNPAVYEGMPEGTWSNREIFRKAAKTGRLRGLLIAGHWMHVGTPEAVVAAEHKLTEIGAE